MDTQQEIHEQGNEATDSSRTGRQEVYGVADQELLARLITETDHTGILFTALRDAGTAAKKDM